MIYTCPFSVPCPIFQQQLLLWAECSFLLFLWCFAGLCLFSHIFVSARVQVLYAASFAKKEKKQNYIYDAAFDSRNDSDSRVVGQ